MPPRSEPTTVWSMDLGWPGPPLRSNDRHHWAKRGGIVKTIRSTAALRARRMPKAPTPCIVTFVWHVTDRRRRDAGASSPTLKACLDGLVDAGVLPDDSLTYVTEERCRIEIGETRGCELRIEAA